MALVNVPQEVGYAALGGLVCAESAGLPVPGGTALIVAGVLAADGDLNIALVCLLGVSTTVLGSNIGYAVGFRFGAKLFLATRLPLARHRLRVLEAGKLLIENYGWLAVLLSRFFPVLREAASLVAGSLRMPWRDFFVWNSLGALLWVFSYVFLGFFVGRTAGVVEGSLILVALKAVALLVSVLIVLIRRRRGTSTL